MIDSSRLYALANELDDYISHAWDAGPDIELVRCALDQIEERIVNTLNALAHQQLEAELRRSIAESELRNLRRAQQTPDGAGEPF